MTMLDARTPLAVDYHELAMYTHNQRCYYWSYVLGLQPPGDPVTSNGEYRLRDLRILDSYHKDLASVPYATTTLEWPTICRGGNVSTIATAQYVERTLGTFKYGGLIQRIALDDTDHAWVIEPTFDEAIPNMYVAGLYWLGQAATATLIRAGDAPERTRFGGVVIHYLKGDISWTHVRCDEYEIQLFLQNAYQLTSEIADKRQAAWTAIKQGQPAIAVWKSQFPHWECNCPWRTANTAKDADEEASLLAKCSETPPWTARTTL